MSSTSKDIFTAGNEVLPAIAGSYGQAPSGYRLPESLRLGAVSLQVADLSRSLSFYEEVLGLRVVERAAQSASLAAQDDDRVLVVLQERAGARPARRRGQLGLFHFAILLPDRPALGRFVQHLADIGVQAGAGDHLVSEAFYLSDPDGLGIEVYADRPRSMWKRIGRELMMATDPVDVAAVVRSAGGKPWSGMPAGTVMGHVHLHVGDLEKSAAFFGDALGFDCTTWSYGGALFFGAGGYHHHLGTNVWAGPSASTPADDDAKLLAWTMELPSAKYVEQLAESLTAGGYAIESRAAAQLTVRDPWGTQIRLAVGA
jgi:catechol 2,3-dioxygenase